MHTLLLLSSVFQLSSSISEATVEYSEDYDDYTYMDVDVNAPKPDGERLVNAMAVESTEQFPFVGAFLLGNWTDRLNPDCTVSLISPSFVLRLASLP